MPTNALAESFNAAFKREVLMDQRAWPDELTCRRQTFRWLTRYNTVRRHSYCDNLPPEHLREPPHTRDASHYAETRRINQPLVSTQQGQAPGVLRACCRRARDNDIERVVNGYRDLAREARTIPYDPAMVDGVLRYGSLRPATRRAWLAAAAAVARGL